ncbi:MAG: 1,4-dihydroxy-6-naphthoate synthase [Planctomycetaceae bacterium]|nr:1,4-dihydroxy-6-naphthoate synthase [Planctomycetaceae bacterium]
MTLAYSPCPNDTFIFNDLAAGTLRLDGYDLDVHLHDVETLNRAALEGRYDITKLSFPAYLRVCGQYELLNAGSAIGYGCGPLVVARRPMHPDELARACVAVPGELTTANLLFRLWAPQAANRFFTRYDQIMNMVAAGEADAGVLIHEGRFVYRARGLHLVADLGAWWQERTGLPIPLGGIAARRTLGERTIRAFDALLRKSVENALAHPQGAAAYVHAHAQEIDAGVQARHIEMFVNDFTVDLGSAGRAAVAQLEKLAGGAGVIT